MSPTKRTVADSLGDVEIDADAPWGAQTQRALLHFAIGTRADDGSAAGGERMPAELLRALVLLKACAAVVNAGLGRLAAPLAQAIAAAADELLAADTPALQACFPLSLWQSGSGTQSHMNVNEVLARRAERRFDPAGQHVHPNDHVNIGQSSNDMVPSAMHVAVVTAVHARLLPALDRLAASLLAQSERHADAVKLGRTHLQDAVPMTMGQEVGAWHAQLLLARDAVTAALTPLQSLAVGGTAVGTGLNTHPDFAAGVCAELARRTGLAWRPADNRFAALAGHEPLVALHGALKVLAVALRKIADDLRLLASGPRGGLGEWRLPANEPGSSIMPGKVNPTQCEALAMVSCQVIGNDAAVTAGACGGHLQLNTFKPLIVANVLRSVRLMADAMASFDVHTVRGMEPEPGRAAALLSGSLMLVTALAPHIGYDRAAAIAHRAHAEGCSLRDAALAEGIAAGDFDRWADPQRMLQPSADAAGAGGG